MSLLGKSHPVTAIPPQAGANAIAGDYISMKKTDRITIQVAVRQGHATPPVLTLHQAKDVSGTGNKVLEKDINIAFVADAMVSDLVVSQPAGVDFTPDAALKDKMVLFDVPAEALDVNNGFTCIQVRAGASNEANIISATYWCTEERYHGASKIVD